MDIVDAQVHLPELPTIPEQPAIKTAVTAMDALGQLGFTRLSIATTPSKPGNQQ